MEIEERIRQAAELARQGRQAEALALAEEIAAQAPDVAEVWALLAQLAKGTEAEAAHLARVIMLTEKESVRHWAQQRLQSLNPEQPVVRRNRSNVRGWAFGVGSLSVALAAAAAALFLLPLDTQRSANIATVPPPGPTSLRQQAAFPSSTPTGLPAPTASPSPTLTLVPTITLSPSPARPDARPTLVLSPAGPSGTAINTPFSASGTRVPAQQVPLSSGLALGGQVPNSLAAAGVMRSAGMTWVKYQIVYEDWPVQDVARLVEQARAENFKVLLSITGRVYPEAIDFAGYNAYLAQAAALQPDAIEVWNEMNLETEWPVGQINPQQYVDEMLAPAYQVIKAASPGTMVIIGALAPTGVNDRVRVWSDDSYIDGLAAAGAARHADCMGAHHNGGATSPRAVSGHPADQSGHHSWYFGPSLGVAHRGMRRALPICLTEYGYLSGEGYPSLPQDWLWAAETSAQDQADWLAEGVTYARELGYVRMMIIWNVDFSRYDIDPQAGFAIVRPGGACPACPLLAQAMQ